MKNIKKKVIDFNTNEFFIKIYLLLTCTKQVIHTLLEEEKNELNEANLVQLGVKNKYDTFESDCLRRITTFLTELSYYDFIKIGIDDEALKKSFGINTETSFAKGVLCYPIENTQFNFKDFGNPATYNKLPQDKTKIKECLLDLTLRLHLAIVSNPSLYNHNVDDKTLKYLYNKNITDLEALKFNGKTYKAFNKKETYLPEVKNFITNVKTCIALLEKLKKIFTILPKQDKVLVLLKLGEIKLTSVNFKVVIAHINNCIENAKSLSESVKLSNGSTWKLIIKQIPSFFSPKKNIHLTECKNEEKHEAARNNFRHAYPTPIIDN